MSFEDAKTMARELSYLVQLAGLEALFLAFLATTAACRRRTVLDNQRE